MSVHIREKNKRLYLDIYVNGKRTWESLGLTLTTLYDYLKKMGEVRNKKKDRVHKVLLWLEKYPTGTTIRLEQVTAQWFTNFQRFLEKDSGLKGQTAFNYAYAVRMALREAERNCLILSDPSDGIKGISFSDPDREYLRLDEVRHLSKVNHKGKIGSRGKKSVFICLPLCFAN